MPWGLVIERREMSISVMQIPIALFSFCSSLILVILVLNFFWGGQHFTPILCIHSLVLWRFLKLGFQVSAKLHSTKDSVLDYSHGFSKFDTRQLFCLAVSPLLWRQMVFLSERGLNELQLISFNYSVIGINHIFHEYKSCFLKFFKKKVCWFSPMLYLF